MDSILKNIISNALKYTPDGGNVHVFTSETEDTWSIEVKDTGIGIPASEQKSCSRCISAAAMLSIPKLPAAASDYSWLGNLYAYIKESSTSAVWKEKALASKSRSPKGTSISARQSTPSAPKRTYCLFGFRSAYQCLRHIVPCFQRHLRQDAATVAKQQ